MQPKDTFFSKKLTINCRGVIIDLSVPKVMGILNVTPDSFYDGGRYGKEGEILNRINLLVTEGVDIIDVGAYSSRPGAKEISTDEEKGRLETALKLIRKNFKDVLISVDTFRSEVARWSVENYGVDVINDISAGDLDENMFQTIARLQVPYIMMHMKGKPENMQNEPYYENVVQEIMKYFSEKINQLNLLGVKDIIIDPGFGFGKTIEHNYQLLKHLEDFKWFNLPILAGVSRKSMIYKFLGANPDESLNGTTILNTIALLNGADIIRVHDVKQAKEAVLLVQKLNESNIKNWYE